MKKAVIFDMDGLLIDSERITFQIFKEYINQVGFEYTEDMYVNLLGKKMDYALEVFQRDFGDAIQMDDFWNVVHTRLDQKLIENLPIKKGCIELLSYLKERNVKTIIATSSHRERVDSILPPSFKVYFHDSICGNEVINGKPNPEIFLKACEKLNVKPEEAIVLEDSEYGILAGYNAQIDVICIPDMLYPGKEYQKMCKYILNDLSEVIEKIEV